MKKFLNKILYINIIFFLYAIISLNNIYAINTDGIVAYPVPFNPKIHQYLNIGYKQGSTFDTVDRVKIEIYDINSDKVFTREYSSLNVLWNGRNGKGNLVETGFYIIKITLENTQTGAYAKKTIRILINR